MCSLHLSIQACDLHSQEKRHCSFLKPAAPAVPQNPMHQRLQGTVYGMYLSSFSRGSGQVGWGGASHLSQADTVSWGQCSLDPWRRWLCECGYISGCCVTRWPVPRACHLDSCLSISHLCAPDMTEQTLRGLAVTGRGRMVHMPALPTGKPHR